MKEGEVFRSGVLHLYSPPKDGRYFLGADIGGTNIRLGVASIRKSRIDLVASYFLKTHSVQNFSHEVAAFLARLDGHIKKPLVGASFGIASEMVHRDVVYLTRAKLKISKAEIRRVCGKAIFLNDFEALGYGLNFENSLSMELVKKGRKVGDATKVAIGAGTGLGKCIMTYNPTTRTHIPLHSEGGRVDLPLYDSSDMKLGEYMKKKYEKNPVSYESVLSGAGVEGIYYFLAKDGNSKYKKDIDQSEDRAALIARYRSVDPVCAKTFEIISKYYGRCVKNLALEAFARGGVYIAGSIAVRNPEIFNKTFFKEFLFVNNTRYVDILKEIPIYMIKDDLAGLKGACAAASLNS